MKLKSIVKDLTQSRERREEYAAIILVRNYEIPADAYWSRRYDKNRIIDIHVDHDDSEIDIIIEPPDRSQIEHPSLFLPEFSDKLLSLPEKCRNYSLCVGYWASEPEDEISVRVDVNIVGVATSKEGLFFGLIQWHTDYQEEFKKQ